MHPLHVENFQDATGAPDGGYVLGLGLSVVWQRGPLGRGPERKDPNGAFVEHVIVAALSRLRYYQASRFKCAENAEAIEHLLSALRALERRTASREFAGVEGTHGQRPAEGGP